MTRPPTIKDVAERAGCGIATVSRVLNGTGSASAATRERVLAAAQALRFEFSALGRSLQSNSTRTIGCVVPSLVNPVFADAVQGAQEAAHAAGYQLLLACSNYDEDLELEAVRTLIATRVDALVLTVSNAAGSASLDLVRARQVPCCLMFNSPTPDVPSWAVDNRAAAGEVAHAFARAGHRHTGFLALRFRGSDRSRERYEGFAQGCRENGMAPPALLEISETEGKLLTLLDTLLARHARLTGLFASNDFLALAAMKAARGLGRRVPEDLSIAGFDGIATGLIVEPNLATVVTDPHAMGEGATRTVLAGLAGKPLPHAPAPALSYEFRSGGSLGTPRTAKSDGGEAATSPPSHKQPLNDQPVKDQALSKELPT